MSFDKWHVDLLFFAAPDLLFNEKVQEELIKRGLVDPESVKLAKRIQSSTSRYRRLIEKTKDMPLASRLLAVAPEIFDESLVNFLRATDVVGKQEAHAMRLMIRSNKAWNRRVPKSKAATLRRVSRVFGVLASEEMISLLLTMKRDVDGLKVPFINSNQADALRVMLIGGELAKETAQTALTIKKASDMLALAGFIKDERFFRALVLSGAISPKTAESLVAATRYGSALWTVWEGSRRADGLAQRLAYTVSGSFSWEAMEFLEKMGLLKDPRAKELLKIAVTVSQAVNRELMEDMTKRKYRRVANEAPIRTFARASRMSERQLATLLADAAEDSRKKSKKLFQLAKVGNRARSRQYTLASREMHLAIRQVFENSSYVTIWGEREVAQAAIESVEDLQARIFRRMTPDVEMMLKYQARSGLDSFISRQSNTLPLSKRVYKNIDIWRGKVDREINVALLQGLSADEFADRIARFISPNTPGGVAYAAKRLARTEISNAFHQTMIRNTVDQPWVTAMKWHKSSSHKHNDICDRYAEDDHANLGPGVFKKRDVPGKPHPHCMCYLTVISVDDETFIRNMKRGQYKSYLKSIATGVEPNNSFSQARLTSALSDIASNALSSTALSLAGTAARNAMG